jgi:hypothetical protein
MNAAINLEEPQRAPARRENLDKERDEIAETVQKEFLRFLDEYFV